MYSNVGWGSIMAEWQQPLIPGLGLGEDSDESGNDSSRGDLGGEGIDGSGEDDGSGTCAERALSFIVAEIARVNGRAACREGGLPPGSVCVSEAGLIDLDALPADDEVTGELIGSGRTVGCFDSPPRGSAARPAAEHPVPDLPVGELPVLDHPTPCYPSAWLKAHFPVEFLAGVLEHNPGSWSRNALLVEAHRIGVPLLPVDINVSGREHRVERIGREVKGIRPPLWTVPRLSGAEVSGIVEGRPFASITEVAERSPVSRASMTALAVAGAFDGLVADDGCRADIIAFVRQLTARARRSAAQDSLLDEALLTEAVLPDPSRATIPHPGRASPPEADSGSPAPSSGAKATERPSPPASHHETADDPDEHVIGAYRPMLDRLGVTSAEAARALRPGAQVLVAGSREAPDLVPADLDEGVEALGLDDGTAIIDVVIDVGRGDETALDGGARLVVRGRTRRTDEEMPFIVAEEILDLDELWTAWLEAQVSLESQ